MSKIKISKISFLKKFSKTFDELHESLEQMTNSKTLSKAWIISMLSGIFDILTFYFVFQSLDIQIDFISSFQYVFTSILFGSFSLIPGGLGITEGSLLALLINDGINFSQASASVLLIRLSTLWYSTILGFVFYKFMK